MDELELMLMMELTDPGVVTGEFGISCPGCRADLTVEYGVELVECCECGCLIEIGET